jgi:glycosyltransferase involved in cell wall biosynthesis
MKPIRVLVLSFYYPPDLSAGSFRVHALVEAMRRHLPAGSVIDLLTTRPNRYSSLASTAPESEADDVVRVRRIELPPHRSGMVDQARAFQTYARRVRPLAAAARYDLVFATSSRLMTAALGSWVARRQRCPLYLDIRDIFVDTIGDVLPRRAAWFLQPGFAQVERYTIRRADRVNLVSEGFRSYFEPRYPKTRFSYFTNGIDAEFLGRSFTGAPAGGTAPLRVLYAGNMGEGQGLHAVVPELARRLGDRVVLRLIGDGGRKPQLAEAVRQARVANVELLPPVPRQKLLEEYRQADVLFLHLNDYAAFKRVLPSKLFEYAATGKPVLAGVAGHAAEFIRTRIPGAEVFPPCDAEAAVQALARLPRGEQPRSEFVREYSRSRIMDVMAAEVVATARTGS